MRLTQAGVEEMYLGGSPDGLTLRFRIRDKQLETAYRAAIQEHLDLGHMTKIVSDQSASNRYYLPHHGLMKESSNTTKLWVVFDGSALSTAGVSLNDTLHTGPKLQEDLFDILLRFRSHQYVLTGDIEKMYRQFLVRPENRKCLRILWRSASGETETYQFNTATFGLSAALYLAIWCLQQLAEDEGHRFPRVASELAEVLQLVDLNIRKWASNDKELLQGLSAEETNHQ
ncbi:uncharacterized protein LOC105681026 [Bombus impatiens]|uniref:Uncharacterized protein LOC105681026 n=1 Tax=Bombus impatiens TaxID=132113 RepID=A0A6P3UXS5_BOMIM|nr:uncharacterized protein LOC105681026 [Bombus impatiens]